MLIRLYAPEAMLGLPVLEEVETMPPVKMRDVTPPPKSTAQALDDFAAAADKAASQREQESEVTPTEEPHQSAGTQAQPPRQASAAGLDPADPIEVMQGGYTSVPSNSEEYSVYALSKIAGFYPGDDVQGWWNDNHELGLRMKCKVGKAAFDQLRDLVNERAAELKRQAVP